MKNTLRRTLSFLLIFLLGVFLGSGLTGCGEKDEREILSAARGLVTAAEPLNEIFWGAGMPLGEKAGYGGDTPYYHVDGAYLSSIGIFTVEQLKEKTRAVYTDAVCDVLFARIFDSAATQENVPYHTPYGQKGIDFCPGAWEKAGNDLLAGAKDEYLLDTLTVSERGKKTAVVTLSVRVTSRTGRSEEQELRLPMVLTGKGWRLDKQIAVSFSAEE